MAKIFGKKKKKNEEEEHQETATKSALPPVSIPGLFRYADKKDFTMIFFGILASMAAGACFPVMMTLYENVTNALVKTGIDTNDVLLQLANELETSVEHIVNPQPNEFTKDELIRIQSTLLYIEDIESMNFMHEAAMFAAGCFSLGAGQFLMCFIFTTLLNASAERQVYRIRNKFFRNILCQDIGWYDTSQTGDFASRLAEDLTKIQEGMGEKIGMFLLYFTIFWTSLVNAFVHGWELTLVTMAIVPLLVVSAAVIGKVQSSMMGKELAAYGKAGAIAEEVLGAIRTVYAFGGQEKENDRYAKSLVHASSAAVKRAVFTATGGGVVWVAIFSGYALAFWYGTKLIYDSMPQYCEGSDCGEYDTGTMLLVFMSVMIGAMNLGQGAPYLETFATGRGAAATIYDIIDRMSPINSLSTEGKSPNDVKGFIEFKNVIFSYPSRPDIPILQGLNLQIKPGETVALVGSSGCGKSTTIQLMQRFYDPLGGEVRLDGQDLRDLNVGWLRQNIGIVGQEPVLFATSILENIRQGKPDATREEIEAAAEEASAHEFISKLPYGYETMVGERGAQLSGGQKQRIAIARALVSNPKILLLDEATSALDNKSEAMVQEALDKAGKGRTTIIVAHRLSTVKNADRICAFRSGVIIEQGSHDELMAKKNLYYSLVTSQVQERDEDGDDDEPTPVKMRNDRVLEQSMSVMSTTSMGSERAMSRTSMGTVMSRNRTINKSERKQAAEEVDVKRVMYLNAEEWKQILAGCVGAVIMGVSMPVYAVVFGDVLGNLSEPDREVGQDNARKYSIIFVCWGIFVGCAEFVKMFMFSYAGNELTMRIRRITYKTMLKQEIGWFDNDENSVGTLCSRLAGDAANIQGATGSIIGTVLQSITTLLLSLGISLYYEWRLGLLMSIFVPVIVVSIYLQKKIITGQSVSSDASLEEASRIAVEAISNIRTVASLHREEYFYDKYVHVMTPSHKDTLNKSYVRGLTFGVSQSVIFFAFATCIWFGSFLVDRGTTTYDNLFKVAQSMIIGTSMVGQAAAFAPNYNKAIVSAARIFKLLDRKPEMDSEAEGKVMLNCTGRPALRNVEFRYPNRPDIKVLKKMNLDMEAGKTYALVGASGCGKSTVIQLVQRFYDPDVGSVSLDGEDLTSLDIPWLRTQLGIVSQEPILFDLTIADNIAYGDNTREVKMEEIIRASMDANIHTFITSLPMGYETPVGSRGTQLSGGQKQRIAIARALVRDPKILLLDEATSALDAESEKVVSEALEKARNGRTCITIAHRLSSIQHVDQIVVVKAGRVIERGTHVELLARKGAYYQLYSASH